MPETKEKYMGQERRGGVDRRESSCPMTEEQAYKMMFTLEKIVEDQQETKSCVKELLGRITVQEDTQKKRTYAGRVVIAIGTVTISVLAWVIVYYKEIGDFFKTFGK